MNGAIKNRYEFVYLFDVKNGNPNGDPDAGNAPRQDYETGKGLVTDVCLKRKIRNYVDITRNNQAPYEIHVREGAFLSEHHKRAHLAIENETIQMIIPEDLVTEFKAFEAYPDGIVFSYKEDERPCLVLSLAGLEETEKKAKALKEKSKKADAENLKLISPAAKAKLRELFIDSKEKKAAQWMCKNFFDVRTFGAVMSTGDMRCGQIRGPVQFGFAESIDSIVGKEISMSRTAEVNMRNSTDKPEKGLGARKSIVPYGLYRVHGYISAHLSSQTNFSEDDLEMLWSALMNMFDQDPAAARTGMHAQKLLIFKHVGTGEDEKQKEDQAKLGCAPAHKLFEMVNVELINKDKPPRSFADYKKIDFADIKSKSIALGVEAIEML
ncbi:MAG: type I-C CRISPR-associated protein Cas7/Csd2 [Desulfobacteraceae bacterium]|nr:type I-C CRISPR-associated protein Cas7/Csd2 [Desulfobacteraceae bacterium]MBC2757961.1 type I-C CRISPR-associated protein Cas7/Csd2 [Desulfobacteraceae bacterium]